MTDDGCKVCRVLRERDLPGHERRMVRAWRGEAPGEREGYRTLARTLNVTILRNELARAGLPTRGGEATSKYDRLAGDDERVAADLRAVLREAGVPVAGLERDFVSYGVVRTHLRDCLGLERDPNADAPADDWPAEAVAYARETAASTVGGAVRAAFDRGDLRVGGRPTVEVVVRVRCPACGAAKPAAAAVDDGAVCTCLAPDDGGDGGT